MNRLPKTRSGKILRGTIRSIVNDQQYKPPATIDDPTALDLIKDTKNEWLAKTQGKTCAKPIVTKERTYIMIKPDGVQRGLVGKIMERFETKGFKLVGMKMC